VNNHVAFGDNYPTKLATVFSATIRTDGMDRPRQQWFFVYKILGDLLLIKPCKEAKFKSLVQFTVLPIPAMKVDYYACSKKLVFDHALLGCTLCGKMTEKFTPVTLGDLWYSINTVNGDCGRPYLAYDHDANIWHFQGIHTWGLDSRKKMNKSTPFFCPVMWRSTPFPSSNDKPEKEGCYQIGYFSHPMNPISSAYESHKLACDLLPVFETLRVDFDKYELKHIDENTYKRGIVKYQEVATHSIDYTLIEYKAADLIFMSIWSRFFNFKPLSLELCCEKAKRAGTGELNHSSAGTPFNKLAVDKVAFIDKYGSAMYDAVKDGRIILLDPIGTSLPKDEVRAVAKAIRFILAMPIHHTFCGVYLYSDMLDQIKDHIYDGSNAAAIGIDLNLDIDAIYTDLCQLQSGGELLKDIVFLVILMLVILLCRLVRFFISLISLENAYLKVSIHFMTGIGIMLFILTLGLLQIFGLRKILVIPLGITLLLS
jgi:hypothetical protein